MFTIMKIAGHSSVTVSQRYVHPPPAGMERAFQRLENLNAAKLGQAAAEAAGGAVVPKEIPKAKNARAAKPSQVIGIESSGP